MRSGGVQGDGTDHTKTQGHIFTRFGFAWHQKVHFSEILEFQYTRNGPQNLPFLSRVSPGHLCYLFFDISPTFIFQKYFQETWKPKIENLEIWKSENLTLQLMCFMVFLPNFSSVLIAARIPSIWVLRCSCKGYGKFGQRENVVNVLL